jgi:hypothetical protein
MQSSYWQQPFLGHVKINSHHLQKNEQALPGRYSLLPTHLLEVVAHDDRIHAAGAEVSQEQAHENRLSATENTTRL